MGGPHYPDCLFPLYMHEYQSLYAVLGYVERGRIHPFQVPSLVDLDLVASMVWVPAGSDRDPDLLWSIPPFNGWPLALIDITTGTHRLPTNDYPH